MQLNDSMVLNKNPSNIVFTHAVSFSQALFTAQSFKGTSSKYLPFRKINHVYMKKSLLYTSGREDPISSKVSKSQNFTVLSADPEKNIVCYKFTSNEG